MLTKLGSEAVNLEQPHVPRFAQATTSCVAPSFSGDPAKGRRTGPRRTTLGRRSGDVARPFPSLMIAVPEASGAAPPSDASPGHRPSDGLAGPGRSRDGLGRCRSVDHLQSDDSTGDERLD